MFLSMDRGVGHRTTGRWIPDISLAVNSDSHIGGETHVITSPAEIRLAGHVDCHVIFEEDWERTAVCSSAVRDHARMSANKSTRQENEVLPQDTTHLMEGHVTNEESPCQDPAGISDHTKTS